MSELMAFRRLAARGRGVTLTLSGPAGIGKSFKAAALLSTLPCRAIHVLADVPVLSLFRIVPALPKEPEWVSNVIRRQERGEMVSAEQLASALHARLNLHVPVVLMVDHLHRCTPAQLEFWKALGELVRAGKGMGLLGLTRAQAPAGWADVDIEPLYRAESDALVSTTLGVTPPQPFLDWLYDRAQGHPLYTLELIRHAQRQGAVQVLDGQARWKRPERDSLPSTLEGLVRSLLPPDLSDGTWRALAELLLTSQSPQAAPEVLKQLEDLGLCEQGQLSHPLYREALLPLMPPALLGSMLEDLSARGGLGNPLQAAQLLSRVNLPPQTTQRILEAGARDAEQQEDWATAAGLWEQASQPLSAARCWCETAGERQRAQGHLRALLNQSERSEENWLEFAALWAKAGEAPEPLLFAVPEPWQRIVRRAYRWAEFDGANREKTIQLWEALSPEMQADASAKVLNSAGTAYYFQTDNLEVSSALLQRARQLNDPEMQASVLNNLGLLPLYRGDFTEAMPYFEQALEALGGVTRNLNRRSTQLSATNNLGICLTQLGHLKEALSLTERTAQQAYSQGDIMTYARQLGRMATILISQGNFQQASQVLSESYDQMRHDFNRDKWHPYFDLIELHFCWLSEQSLPLLAHYVTELEHLVSSNPQRAWLQEYFMLALGLVACGQPQAAQTYLDRGNELALEHGITQGIIYGHWIQGHIQAEYGDWGEAATQAQLASDLARRQGNTIKADSYALWAALYRQDRQAFEEHSARLGALGYHGDIHAVQVRWQLREPVAAPQVQHVATLPHLHVLGGIRLYQPNGLPLTSRTGTQLLVLLLCARLTGLDGLNLLEVAEEIFPERDEANAVRALRRLMNKLRGSLGEGVIQQSGERLLLGELQSDAELFLETQEPTLWRGLFLNDQGIGEHTDAARNVLLTRLEGLTEALLDTDPGHAERLAELLGRHEPYEPRLLALQLRAHDAAGHPRQAGAAYRKASEQFAEVGEKLPDTWPEFLKQQQTGAAPALVALSSGPSSGTVSAARQARALNVHRSTILRWQKGAVQHPGQRGRTPQLSEDVLAQVRGVMQCPPAEQGLSAPTWTLAVIADYVNERHGVRLSRSQLSRLLRRDAPTG